MCGRKGCRDQWHRKNDPGNSKGLKIREPQNRDAIKKGSCLLKQGNQNRDPGLIRDGKRGVLRIDWNNSR
jgi:hypothetical protein